MTTHSPRKDIIRWLGSVHAFCVRRKFLIISNSGLNRTGKLCSAISPSPSDSPDFLPTHPILKPQTIQINLLKFKTQWNFNHQHQKEKPTLHQAKRAYSTKIYLTFTCHNCCHIIDYFSLSFASLHRYKPNRKQELFAEIKLRVLYGGI